MAEPSKGPNIRPTPLNASNMAILACTYVGQIKLACEYVAMFNIDEAIPV